MHDLGEPVHRIVEAVVEAVDEDQNAWILGPAGGLDDGCGERLAVDVIGGDRHEIALRIAGQGRRPLHLSDLPVRRDRDGHGGVRECIRALAAEHFAGILCRSLAGGRDQNRDARCSLDLILDGNQHALRRAVRTAAAQCRRRDCGKNEHPPQHDATTPNAFTKR